MLNVTAQLKAERGENDVAMMQIDSDLSKEQ